MNKLTFSLAIYLISCLASLISAEISSRDVQKLANKLYSRPSKVLEEIKTVQDMIKLADYFLKMKPEDKLISFRDRYFGAFMALEIVLKSYNNDVCGRKLKFIERFFKDYVSTSRDDRRWQKEAGYETLNTINHFFLHYAYKVGVECREALSHELKTNPIMIDGDIGKFNQFMDKLSHSLSLDIEQSYLFQPWQILDNLLQMKNKDREFVSDVLAECHKENCIRLSIRVHDASKISTFQRFCRLDFRPVYSKLILPVMRLYSMGLYDKDDPRVLELANDQFLKRLYKLTQVCEIILPVEVLQDDSLGENEIIAMTRENAEKLRNSNKTRINRVPFRITINAEMQRVSFENLSSIQTLVDSDRLRILTDKLKANRLHQEGLTDLLMEKISSIAHSERINEGHRLTVASNSALTKIQIQETYSGHLVRRDARSLMPFMKRASRLAYFFSSAFGYCLALISHISLYL